MNIGLVLSGGMAKGAYQIGVLKALSEFLPMNNIKYISCASVGVLNGYAYATGKLEQAENLWRGICNSDSRLIINQILRSSMLQQNIYKIYSTSDKLIPSFYISLLDYSNKKIVYKNISTINSDEIITYLKASVAMPLYNHSVNICGTQYFDGAIIDNIPIYPLLRLPLDYIICVYFDENYYVFENTHFDNKVIKIVFPGNSMLKQSLIFQQDSINEMICDGYERTRILLSAVFLRGYEDLNSVYREIEISNSLSGNRKLRITGDMLVSNLNRFAQRFAERRII